jgi:hypothetical protein
MGLGLVGLIGLGRVSLIRQISLIDSSASSNHWSIGLIGVIGVGLNCLIGFIGLIGLVGLIGFIGLVGLVSFGLNGLIGRGIIINSLQFEIEMKQSQHALFRRESWLWCVRRVFSSLPGLSSVFGNALQNATKLFFDRIPQMTKYCVMRECENIHS